MNFFERVFRCFVRACRLFRCWQIRGSLRSYPSSDTYSVCLNCGNRFVGNYCNRCGQESFVDDPKGRDLVTRDLVSASTNFDPKFFSTVVNLLFRPGYMIGDYLNGKRVRYTNPFLFLFILSAIYVFMETLSGHHLSVGSLLLPFVDISIPRTPDNNWIYSISEAPILKFILQNKAFFVLLSLPVWIPSLLISFRSKRLKPHLVAFEWAVVQTYISGLVLMILILLQISSMVPYFRELFSSIPYIVVFLLHFYAINQLLDGPFVTKLFRLLLAYIIYVISFVGVLVALYFISIVFYALLG